MIKFISNMNKWHLSKKTLVIFGILILVFIVGVILTWGYFLKQNATVDIDYFTSDTALNAKKLAESGDIESAKIEYDKAIDETKDSYHKSALILSKANVFYNAGDYKNALDLALEAESIDKNSLVEQYIAEIYVVLSDNANAIKYFQNAIDLVNKNDFSASSDVYYYQLKIDELKNEK